MLHHIKLCSEISGYVFAYSEDLFVYDYEAKFKANFKSQSNQMQSFVAFILVRDKGRHNRNRSICVSLASKSPALNLED